MDEAFASAQTIVEALSCYNGFIDTQSIALTLLNSSPSVYLSFLRYDYEHDTYHDHVQRIVSPRLSHSAIISDSTRERYEYLLVRYVYEFWYQYDVDTVIEAKRAVGDLRQQLTTKLRQTLDWPKELVGIMQAYLSGW
jgi:hypothetical protein